MPGINILSKNLSSMPDKYGDGMSLRTSILGKVAPTI